MEFVCPAKTAAAPLANITFYFAQKAAKIKVSRTGESVVLTDGDNKIEGEIAVALHLAKALNLPIYPEAHRAEIDAHVNLYPKVQDGLLQKDFAFVVGNEFTLADIAVYAAIQKSGLEVSNNWYNTVAANPMIKRYHSSVNAEQNKKTAAKKAEAPKEKVCTRFAPEPSGYLHIGHAKAALASEMYTRSRGGEFILRFDDTNPKNESAEFEEIIKKDLELLDIKFDRCERTSDYIPIIIEKLVDFIKQGKAYVDDTPADVISEQRLKLQPSVHRDDTVEQNLAAWEEMLKRTEHGLKCVVRAKIDYQSKNGVMRDPVIARHIENGYHPKTGTKYPVFPVYDFACPIVDSLAGVTHAMRSWEYTDRDHLYYYFIDALHLRKVKIISFSRLSFTHTALGKRHLRKLVAEHLAEGWDDPRFPTVRGLRRRGLIPDTLKQFCQAQGASATQNMHEWGKLWSLNRAIIQPSSPRVMSIAPESAVKLYIEGAPEGVVTCNVNDKVKTLGTKELATGPNVLIEEEDAKLLQVGGKACLLHWNTFTVTDIQKDGEKIVEVKAKWLGDNDFKSTKKLNWIVADKAVEITMREWNYLIEEPIYNPEMDITKAICKVPFADTKLLVDASINNIKQGQILQLERRADCIVDKIEDGKYMVFLIPTGTIRNLGLPIKIQLFAEESQ
ncbi:hypothetical protein TVAG_047990 [Trichomonas vaginalis G3]|uniref:Glutamate--tRNA ligase n=1 Tax=Trichomonas vaginalis (strain ATCC PRA-98 / G3) TaxID=412133 RepID=A2EZH8_TRIV3|nr:glutamine-tRNA ligase family [Trichomonas vaginalis G3]EAY01944.1 hypothetical protein TVAG_047990 [Trichomonas vaginalis G3]KAI5506272.1 glutamine-tRNA ligase family [Trichomonas vaginalis G3]|eukprot:XP_001330459.1 hypothetical protein [Trichomonas vaginalis G3]